MSPRFPAATVWIWNLNEKKAIPNGMAFPYLIRVRITEQKSSHSESAMTTHSGCGGRTRILNLWSIWNIRPIFASWLASFESNNPLFPNVSFTHFPVREKTRETLNVLWLDVQYKLLPPVPIFYIATGGESITIVDTLSHKFVQAEHTACTIFREER